MAEYNATGGGWRTDFLLDGADVGQIYDSSGDVQMWATDALGSAVEYLHDGTLQISRLYPFGEEGQSTSAEYKWTNQIRDGDALDHFAFRTYASNLARWLSPDPAGLAAVNPADPQSWNRYAYVVNQPLTLTDPDGRHLRQPGEWDDWGCTLDGQAVDCADVQGGLGGGAEVQCPNNDCSPFQTGSGGSRQWAVWQADANGFISTEAVGLTWDDWVRQQENAAFVEFVRVNHLKSGTTYTFTVMDKAGAITLILNGASLDTTAAAANGVELPLDSLFHGGRGSWYQGDIFGFDVLHDVDNALGAEVHVDPVGPGLLPLHAIQVIAGWVLPPDKLGMVQCQVSIGCY